MIATFYPPYHFGGDATYVRALSEALVEKGHDVTVIHCEDAFNLLSNSPPSDFGVKDSAVKVIRLKSNFGFLSPLITQQTGRPGLKSGKISKILDGDYDVVNFHNISLVGGPGVIEHSRAQLNIYTLHEHWLLCPTHIFWKNRQHACDKKECLKCSLKSGVPPQLWRNTNLIKNSVSKIDHFIAPSQFTADQHIKGGIAENIKVLPLFSYLSPETYDNQSEGKLNFITVGRITASKGIAALVASFAKWPDVELNVVGDGDLLADLKQQYDYAKNITFTGSVPQHQLVELYRKTTALILPSLAPETFGLTVIEAFSCGVPAIVKIAGGNREIIDQHGGGFLYNTEEELHEIISSFLKNKELRKTLGLKAREAYEKNYTKQIHVDAYLAFVEQQLSQKNNVKKGENSC